MNKISPEILRGSIETISPEILRQVSEPCGLECHHCGSDYVYEMVEIDPDTLTTLDVFYWCTTCGDKWSYAIGQSSHNAKL